MRRLAVAALLVAILSWHGLGLWRRWGPVGPVTAAERLQIGSMDRDERQRCLEALRDAGGSDSRGRVMAMAAAIQLDDRGTFARLLATAGPERALFAEAAAWPAEVEAARALVDEAAHGELWLRHLLWGSWLRATGVAGAAAEFEVAVAAARASGAQLGGELAAAGLAALPPARR